jgi:hypothetical protein
MTVNVLSIKLSFLCDLGICWFKPPCRWTGGTLFEKSLLPCRLVCSVYIVYHFMGRAIYLLPPLNKEATPPLNKETNPASKQRSQSYLL